MKNKGGHFVISLDLELFWGMFDKHTIKSYGDRILGERVAIPKILALFRTYEIHATWATVGMLMTKNRDALCSFLPPKELRPIYDNMHVSAYTHLEDTAAHDDTTYDIYHHGGDLVRMIQQTPYQEIGNHTFSHFYCIDGHHNDSAIFAADLDAHAKISKTYNIVTETIVFPRNQSSEEALRVCKKKGIYGYRGNENHFLYRPRKDTEQTPYIRMCRLVDHYVNISGHHTYTLQYKNDDVPLNIPASRFLRPWNSVLRIFEPLRLRRITNAMTYAAKHNEIFHLWWHPHNFGSNQDENIAMLCRILEHYESLKNMYAMKSSSMADIVRLPKQ